MATTQTFSASVTAVSEMAASLRRRSAAIACANCGRTYSMSEACDRTVMAARTKDGQEFKRFRCDCGDGTTVAGAVAYDPVIEIASTKAPNVSHCAQARKLLTGEAMAEARKNFVVENKDRADVIARMEEQKAKNIETQLAIKYMREGVK